ncbi:hypothetical protein A0H81_05364 [Grifola frondosa]|uniref:RRM domain-containing protein n=1 Tax=Grifola frondosa TaxID=5627 RepID=A0A1C7MCA7_GRIFR|nr:hypothetical protein A0H81_05364 [Grifola frondosa]
MSASLDTDLYDDLYADNDDNHEETAPPQEEPSGKEGQLASGKPSQSIELSYSAQVAKQFSQYKQTPAQERQQYQISPSTSNLHLSGADGADGLPHEDHLPRRPVRPSEMKDEGKMFVGGLSWDTTDEGLRKYFSEFGKVEDCTILRDPDGRSRGFAFLTFEDPASVNAVMVREHVLDGKAIDPKRAIPREEHLRNTRYFVGGLSHATTTDSMRAFFSAYGKGSGSSPTKTPATQINLLAKQASFWTINRLKSKSLSPEASATYHAPFGPVATGLRKCRLVRNGFRGHPAGDRQPPADVDVVPTHDGAGANDGWHVLHGYELDGMGMAG